jgi:hypothetical protein
MYSTFSKQIKANTSKLEPRDVATSKIKVRREIFYHFGLNRTRRAALFRTSRRPGPFRWFGFVSFSLTFKDFDRKVVASAFAFLYSVQYRFGALKHG